MIVIFESFFSRNSFLVLPLIVFTVIVTYYILRRYYKIYKDRIDIYSIFKLVNYSIRIGDINFVYFYDMDKPPIQSLGNRIRGYGAGGKELFILWFTDPDGEDLIKVFKFMDASGVKIKIDKRTKFEPILRAFGKLK